MAKKNYRKGNVKVEGRTFQIEFWEDPCLGVDLPYFRVSEIITETKKPWYSNKDKTYRREIEISYGWTANNRLDLAKCKIDDYLQIEKYVAEEKKQIEEFCNMKR